MEKRINEKELENKYEPSHDQVRHKPACTVTGKREEGFYYPCSETKGADQLRGYRKAGLRLASAYADCWFPHAAAHIQTYLFLKLKMKNYLKTKH